MIASPSRATEGSCSVCGRYVGPGIECPYCEAPLEGGATLRTLRWFALLTAVVGLFILWQAARRAQPAAVPLGTLNPMMNGAQLRVQGLVSRPPLSAATTGHYRSFSFRLTEGNINVLVIPHGRALRTLQELDPPLRRGDTVEVTGRLALTGPDNYRLYAQSVDAIRPVVPRTE